MKKETTMKYICAIFDNIYQCGYADLQFIFHNITADYYNAGIYGWNCDIYILDDVVITTGYRNTRGKKIPHELIKKYSDKAEKIIHNHNDYSIKGQKRFNAALKRNREKFINELTHI